MLTSILNSQCAVASSAFYSQFSKMEIPSEYTTISTAIYDVVTTALLCKRFFMIIVTFNLVMIIGTYLIEIFTTKG